MTFQVIRFLMLILFVIVFIRIAWPNGLRFIDFMFNKDSPYYDEKIEKPRLLFHIVAFIIIGLSFILLKGLNSDNYFKSVNGFYFILSLSIFVFGILLSFYSWSKHFENTTLFLIKNMLEKDEIKFREDIDSIAEAESLIRAEKVKEESKDDLVLLFQNKKIKNKIIWTSLANNRSEYKSIFPTLHRLVEGGIYPISIKKRKALAIFICLSFEKDEKAKKVDGDFSVDNLDRTFLKLTKRDFII